MIILIMYSIKRSKRMPTKQLTRVRTDEYLYSQNNNTKELWTNDNIKMLLYSIHTNDEHVVDAY